MTKNVRIPSEWINIEEKLPKPFENVLLLYNGREVIYGFTPYEGKRNIDASFYGYVLVDFQTERTDLDPIGAGRVTHWMPLPQPPTTIPKSKPIIPTTASPQK